MSVLTGVVNTAKTRRSETETAYYHFQAGDAKDYFMISDWMQIDKHLAHNALREGELLVWSDCQFAC